MADRGFLLEEEMAQKAVKLIKPPNMTRKGKNRKSKKEFTAREEVATKSVAAVRIYVEHVIGKPHVYTILPSATSERNHWQTPRSNPKTRNDKDNDFAT
ncbi:tRNA modification GTPase MnmE [Frankliniella fusca]|uniref:tRNA modification GTPase MnmE n=1 Tax=Frankliniella fusca TaxID=407009 RepID=A0AAE1HT79_9NEOP|nr:tRNA modification GTPase MnmE [Frankliniella fusca]